MSNMKRLSDVKQELAKLASAAALSADFQGYKDIRKLLMDMETGDSDAIDRAFKVYEVLTGASYANKN